MTGPYIVSRRSRISTDTASPMREFWYLNVALVLSAALLVAICGWLFSALRRIWKWLNTLKSRFGRVELMI